MSNMMPVLLIWMYLNPQTNLCILWPPLLPQGWLVSAARWISSSLCEGQWPTSHWAHGWRGFHACFWDCHSRQVVSGLSLGGASGLRSFPFKACFSTDAVLEFLSQELKGFQRAFAFPRPKVSPPEVSALHHQLWRWLSVWRQSCICTQHGGAVCLQSTWEGLISSVTGFH